nr:MAG TPA: hypothetical protein [Caudoviricetes sp.]
MLINTFFSLNTKHVDRQYRKLTPNMLEILPVMTHCQKKLLNTCVLPSCITVCPTWCPPLNLYDHSIITSLFT